MLKNDTLQNGTSRIGLYGSAPPPQDGRPDESCSSFTLMYFGKRWASRINLFWNCRILLMIVSDVVMVGRKPYSKIARTHCL